MYHNARNQSVQIMENEITDHLGEEHNLTSYTPGKTQNTFADQNDYTLKSNTNIVMPRQKTSE